MLYQLFSSFLRGASCPKSPRAPPLPAALFMRLTGKDVKAEKIQIGEVPIMQHFFNHAPKPRKADK
jgi:hypothetical protein